MTMVFFCISPTAEFMVYAGNVLTVLVPCNRTPFVVKCYLTGQRVLVVDADILLLDNSISLD